MCIWTAVNNQKKFQLGNNKSQIISKYLSGHIEFNRISKNLFIFKIMIW